MRILSLILLGLLSLAPAASARTTLRFAPRHASARRSYRRAGESERIEWAELPAWAEEVELELSLDGGRWLRISPELEARDGGHDWVIPASACDHARLRLRAGGEHREEVLALSEEFRIECTSMRVSAGDDWWHLAEGSGSPLAMSAPLAQWRAADATAPGLLASRVTLAAPRELATRAALASRPREPRLEAPACTFPMLASYPLRN